MSRGRTAVTVSVTIKHALPVQENRDEELRSCQKLPTRYQASYSVLQGPQSLSLLSAFSLITKLYANQLHGTWFVPSDSRLLSNTISTNQLFIVSEPF